MYLPAKVAELMAVLAGMVEMEATMVMILWVFSPVALTARRHSRRLIYCQSADVDLLQALFAIFDPVQVKYSDFWPVLKEEEHTYVAYITR